MIGQIVKRAGQVIDVDQPFRLVQMNPGGEALAHEAEAHPGLGVELAHPVGVHMLARDPHGADQIDEFRIGAHIRHEIEQIIRAVAQPQPFNVFRAHRRL